MRRTLAAVVIAAAAACTPTATPTPTAGPVSPPPSSADPVTLTVSGSGRLCGPWWMGCGAALVIEQPGWTLPAGWLPGARDIVFEVDLRPGTEKPARVTGVRQIGTERLEPGDYLLAGILTSQSDVATEPPSASLGCSTEIRVLPGTRGVAIELTFGPACSIDVTMIGAPVEGTAPPT